MTVDPRHPMVRLVAALTEPILGPLRSFLTFGSLDLSPLAAIVVIELILRPLGG